MQITVSRAKLSEALSELAPLAGKNKVIPVFNYVKFVTKGSRIRLQTSDSETTIRKYIEAESIDQDESFLVECASLNALVNKTKGDTINLTLDGNTLTVKHAKGKAEFQTLAADDFPEPKQDEATAEATIPASNLARLVVAARGFVGTNDLHPQMKPIRAIIDNGRLTLCATDTRRLFTDSVMLGPDAPSAQWFIEPSVFGALVAACKNQDDIVVRVSEKNVSYRVGTTNIFTQQTKGNYPDFKRVIPATHDIDVVCDKSELVESIQRAMLFCDSNGLITVTASQLILDIKAENLVKLTKAKESVACSSNADITFGADASMFLDCVKACASDELVMELTTSSRPIVFKDASNPDRTVLCMPMNIPQ